jgi:hypothetical protein
MYGGRKGMKKLWKFVQDGCDFGSRKATCSGIEKTDIPGDAVTHYQGGGGNQRMW